MDRSGLALAGLKLLHLAILAGALVAADGLA
jgi:hypothetical protein